MALKSRQNIMINIDGAIDGLAKYLLHSKSDALLVQLTQQAVLAAMPLLLMSCQVSWGKSTELVVSGMPQLMLPKLPCARATSPRQATPPAR